MQSFHRWVFATRLYLLFSILAILSVSLMALFEPQSVMDFVGVKLSNTDAISSIRGVYGGVGFTICLTLAYLFLLHPEKGAAFLSVFWGSYAFSRLITLISEGPLGDFGNQWMILETLLALMGLSLWYLLQSKRRSQKFILKPRI
ncbi:MAG: DUF4345 domain-containing protein [Cyclobacteriaceae bacterium]|nr:DUF4345 domain-containing protein [Cyclobacteriaceae bacterium]MDX5465353.1 DUF4345 domain-containing protein [Cyclobacteriaceae bacterium]